MLGGRFGATAFDKEDGAWFHVAKFPLPRGWSKPAVEVLIDIPWGVPGYPVVPPQWFWTDKDLRTSVGQTIGHFFSAAGTTHADREYLDKEWGHFCVHLRAWRPLTGRGLAKGHNLLTYFRLIDTVFRDRVNLAGR
jgi:hypothetical protein